MFYLDYQFEGMLGIFKTIYVCLFVCLLVFWWDYLSVRSMSRDRKLGKADFLTPKETYSKRVAVLFSLFIRRYVELTSFGS